MINSDKEFLNWIYERMICVHGERDMYDYMINFKSVIDRLPDMQKDKEGIDHSKVITKEPPTNFWP